MLMEHPSSPTGWGLGEREESRESQNKRGKKMIEFLNDIF